MTPDVAKAHVAALLDWAHEWEQDATTDNAAGEVSYLMRRTIRTINRTLGQPVEPEEVTPAASVEFDHPRAG